MNKVLCILLCAAILNTTYGSNNEAMDEYVAVYKYGEVIIEDTITNDGSDFFRSIISDFQKEFELSTVHEAPSSPYIKPIIEIEVEFFDVPLPIHVNLDIDAINNRMELLNRPNKGLCIVS